MRLAVYLLLAGTLGAQKPAPSPVRIPQPPANHITGLAATVAGRPIPGVYGPSAPLTPGGPAMRPRGVRYIPYYAPYYFGGGGGYYYGEQPQMPVTVVQQQTAPAQNALVVNPDYVPDVARPVLREYTAESHPWADAAEKKELNSGSPIYLIAMKDGSMSQAVAYWSEAGSLYYVKPDHKQERVLLDRVDRETSQRFNRERGIDFKLP